MRNAGARVTDDVLRSLVKSIIQLGRRAGRGHAPHRLRGGQDRAVRAAGGGHRATGNDPAEVDFHLIGDPQEALRDDVEALCRHPYLPAGLEVLGLLYDVTTGVADDPARRTCRRPAVGRRLRSTSVRRRGSG